MPPSWRSRRFSAHAAALWSYLFFSLFSVHLWTAMDLSAYARGLDKPARLRYLEKVRLCGGVDPLELQDAELQRDIELLPRVDFTDIKDYLVHSTSFVSRKAASQVSFASSTMRKRQMGGEEPLRKRQKRRNVEKPTNEEWASFLSSCHASRCRPALLSLEEDYAKEYVPVATKFPTAVLGNPQADDVPATWESTEAHCCRVAGTLSLEKEVAEEIEKETRQQSKSSKWFAFRAGRITASNAKAMDKIKRKAPTLVVLRKLQSMAF
ncbi:hypothetical protein HPB52_025235 [Rhipicephalus sanguineus]|uniref:Uncharacterized protein n=1 Tax=Rhipicephalus sanguineus TaxID=34632 RepID=A0A9D4P9U3_RHISA|nr:hypothetical protein HPB52_025235 [Rhipicephalus sanguineus]